MDFTEFGWREGFLLAVVAAAAYLVVVLVALIRLRRRDGAAVPPVPDRQLKSEKVDTSLAAEPGIEVPVAPFGEHLAWMSLEIELGRLRAEVDGLRAEMSELKAARRVSPLYAEAVALARRGFDARGIAAECGISVAEAELVQAMSDGGKNFDGEVDDGGSGQGEPIKPSGR